MTVKGDTALEARDWARMPDSFHEEIERSHVVVVGADGSAPLARRGSIRGVTGPRASSAILPLDNRIAVPGARRLMAASVKPVEVRRWRATVGPDQRGEPDPERQEPPVSDERAEQGRPPRRNALPRSRRRVFV